LKILLVASDLGRSDELPHSIQLANALSREHQVFLCNAHPGDLSENLVAEVNREIVFLEGTLGQFPYSWTANPRAAESQSGQSSRCDALRELIRIHQVDVIHSRGEAADRLVLDLKRDVDTPWFTHLDSGLDFPPENDAAPSSSILLRVLQSAIGVFHKQETDVSELRKLTHPSDTRFICLPAASEIDSISAICGEVYAEARRLQQRPGTKTLPIPREKTSRSTRQSA
jgi:hypothetical protein